MPNFPQNPNGFPMAPMAQPDPQQQFAQRLETSLNPSIGVPQKDTDPQAMAQYMVQSNPGAAASMLAKVLMMMRQRVQSQPSPPVSMPQQPQQPPQMPQHQMTPQAMIPQGGQ
jgi:hypothetical protein